MEYLFISWHNGLSTLIVIYNSDLNIGTSQCKEQTSRNFLLALGAATFGSNTQRLEYTNIQESLLGPVFRGSL